MAKYSEEELAGLTEEEREALLEDDEEEGAETEGTEETEAAEAEDEEEQAEEGEGETEGDAEAETTEEQETENAEEGERTEEEPKRPEPEVQPLLNAELPEGYEDKVKEIADGKQKLAERFEDGDMTTRDYQTELDKLNKQERDLELEVYKANLAKEMREQQELNAWQATVNAFLDEHTAYRENDLMYKTLDVAVKDIAQKAQDAGENVSGREILNRAHAQIQESFGLSTQQETQQGQQEQQPEKPKKGAKPQAPPTLGKLPAADVTETENSKYAALDKLMEQDPERYEAELAKMSDEERDRYLASQ